MDGEKSTQSIASSARTSLYAELNEITASSSSRTPAGVSASTDNILTAFEFTTVRQPPSASPVSGAAVKIGSHTYRFKRYSQRGLRIGKYLASNTFIVGGYKWAINLYPNGKKDQCNGYVSLYVRLKSEETDVCALFQLTLLDQSGQGKHKICTVLGRGREMELPLMTNSGIQWGFPRFMNKHYLETSGYLKDDCLLVKCVVGVLLFGIPVPVSLRTNDLSSIVGDQVTQLTQVQQIEKSNCKDDNLSYLWSLEEIFGSATQLGNDGDHEQSAQYSSAVAIRDIMPSINSRVIPNQETLRTNSIKMLQAFQVILDSSISIGDSIGDSESSTTYSSSVTSNSSYELQGGGHPAYGEFSGEQVYRLHSIVEWLNSAGCLGNSNELYIVSRKSALDAKLLRFGIGKMSINYLKGMHWEESTKNIRLWILAVNNCYRNIFPRERHYYELIFDGVGAVTYDNCFLAIVKHVAVELIHSVEAITAATASFQNMFDILDLYEAMLAVLPKIEAVFQSVPSLDIYSRATKTIDTLIILARKLFLSFEDTVLNEQSDTPLASGRVHSVTRYTMDYVARILRYRELLKDILVSVPTKSLGNSDEEQFLEAQARAPLEQHVTWIIISLKINLEGKSCHYKDSSLRYAFLLYNADHIIQVISGSPKLLEMIGKDHLSKLNKDVADAAQNYISSTWDRVWYCLADNGSNQWFTFYSGVSGNVLKQKLKKFKKLFEEVYETQCTQLGPHIQLRGHLLELILKKLIPAYKSFLDKFTSNERYNETYIKYSLQDLENKVQNLFLEH